MSVCVNALCQRTTSNEIACIYRDKYAIAALLSIVKIVLIYFDQ